MYKQAVAINCDYSTIEQNARQMKFQNSGTAYLTALFFAISNIWLRGAEKCENPFSRADVDPETCPRKNSSVLKCWVPFPRKTREETRWNPRKKKPKILQIFK